MSKEYITKFSWKNFFICGMFFFSIINPLLWILLGVDVLPEKTLDVILVTSYFGTLVCCFLALIIDEKVFMEDG